MKNAFIGAAIVMTIILTGSNTVLADEAESSGPLTGNIAVVSDYLFDGVSQTDNAPALQAGINYAFDSGFYLGLWGSSVDFNSNADVESDWYLGYGFGSEAIAFDVGAVHYKYVPTDDSDYNEYWLGVTALAVTVKLWYTDDYGNSDYCAYRVKASYSVAINDDWSIPLEVTKTEFDNPASEGYNSYKIGLASSFCPVDAELSYQMTDLKDGGDIYSEDGTVVLSLSHAFGG